MRLEINYDKDQILEGYLNTINFGHGADGIEAASQYYYGKSAKDLTLAEAALLIGIPKGPGVYSPFYSAENAKNRQLLILNEMHDLNMITAEEKNIAAKEELTLVGKHPHHRAEI